MDPVDRSEIGRIVVGGLPVSIFMKGIVALFVVAAAAWNVFFLIDAVSFDMGENISPACGAFHAFTGVRFLAFAFLAQLIICSVLIAVYRSWLIVILSVLPFWALFGSQICVVP
jgi:hypothetical protein